MNDARQADAGNDDAQATPDGDGDGVLAAALRYAERRSWKVFPCESGGKRPLTPHGFKNASSDPEVIRGWWGRWPTANVAIRTGRESGIVVLDVDPRNGGDESLALVEANLGRLPRTLVVRTGGGGLHFYFAHPGHREIRCAKDVGGLRGLDVKADGGYVIAPPSLHESGACYAWAEP